MSADQNRTTESQNGQEMPNQIKNLSEEVLRLRDKIANHNSEYLAMKNRLKAATDRSSRLEDELQTMKLSTKNDGEPLGFKKGSGGKRRYVGSSNNTSSIRNAMLLNSTNGDRTEQIGQVVDQIDSFAASTGEFCAFSRFYYATLKNRNDLANFISVLDYRKVLTTKSPC